MHPETLAATRRILLLPWHGWLLVGLLALASVSAKALGAAWVLFVGVGLWGLRQAWAQNKTHPFPSFIGFWTLAALAGFLAKAVATVYWHDPWGERHGEIRILLGAIAVYGMYGHWRSRLSQQQALLVWVSHALSLTALLGLAWVVWRDSLAPRVLRGTDAGVGAVA